MGELLGVVGLVAVLLFVAGKFLRFRRVTVYEYQKGLKYTKGRYVSTLNPGQYWIFPFFSSVVPVDVRPQFVTIPGQDVLSADGVTLRVSLAAEFQVADPNVAINKNASFQAGLYLTLQMAVREIVGKEKIDTLIENRAGFGSKLNELTSAKATEFGLKLISADIKDIMFPGEMKKAFAQVVKAQKDGQAALEKARGETAALRSLANAAKMMDDNPNLLQLRALQAFAETGGNTLVLGLPQGSIPLVKPTAKTAGPARKDSKEKDDE
ncbi:MAG TPA: slipin family protein [Candidatus Acidoferrum sp.]|jgi:regulator of protease activity HflC (stomatin/prohibitin superfamily)